MTPSDTFAVTLDDSSLLVNPYEIHCQRCGKCCTEMMVRVPIPPHATAEEHLKAREDAERFYRIHGFDVLPSMAGEIVLRIPTTCQHLVNTTIIKSDPCDHCGRDDLPDQVFALKEATCAIYADRPEVCRKFECQKCRQSQEYQGA